MAIARARIFPWWLLCVGFIAASLSACGDDGNDSGGDEPSQHAGGGGKAAGTGGAEGGGTPAGDGGTSEGGATPEGGAEPTSAGQGGAPDGIGGTGRGGGAGGTDRIGGHGGEQSEAGAGGTSEDACQNVVCEPSEACREAVCDSTTGGCIETLKEAGTACDDGNACNGAEQCDEDGECVAGAALPIDDGDLCTLDRCDAAVGVVHELTPACQNLPPDPASVAPPVRRDVATTVFASTKFLYEGEPPIQVDMAAGAIDAPRAAVVRGRIVTREGAALPGVVVRVLNQPQYGSTKTRRDGGFDLAVNGGAPLVLDFEREGFLPAQRHVTPRLQNFAVVPDLAMIPMDAAATRVELSASHTNMRVARASRVTDAWGSRQTTLLFPRGVEAWQVDRDGITTPLASLTLHATEYTVGASGPMAMPAELPASSAYTHAFEVSVEDLAPGGHVRFSKPVVAYLENFLWFPTGIPVPLGYYDRARATWVASDNGVIIEIVDVAGDEVVLSLAADGSPASSEVLAEHGITHEELKALAAVPYEKGQRLWRMPLPHFSTWDANWGWGPPDGSRVPDSESPCPDGNCASPGGSPSGFGPNAGGGPGARGGNLNCMAQAVTQRIGLAGTPFALHYSSDEAKGYKPASSVDVRVTNGTPPSVLRGIRVETEISGRTLREWIEPKPNLVHTIEWDRKDAYGRTVLGGQQAIVRVGYTYEGSYSIPPRFGYNGNGVLISTDAPSAPWAGRMPPITLWKEHHLTTHDVDRFSSRDPLGQGLGGWSVDVHHRYDPVGRILHLGTGAKIDQSALPSGVRHNVNRGPCPNCGGASLGDGVRIRDVGLNNVGDVLGLPDGSLVFMENSRIWHVRRDGTLWRLAGGGTAPAADGEPARNVTLDGAFGLALRDDGTVVFVDGHAIKGVDLNGILRVFAGTGAAGYSGDGASARDATFSSPKDLAVGRDQSIYVSDFSNNRVRRITPEGLVETFAGTGELAETGDGGPARFASLERPVFLAAARDGSVFVATRPDAYEQPTRIRRISPDGTIHAYAGGCDDWRCATGPGLVARGTIVAGMSGMAIGPDEKVYYEQNGYYVGDGHPGVNVWRVNAQGLIDHIIGGTSQGRYCRDQIPAIPSCFGTGGRLDVAADGTVYASNNTYWDGQTQFDGTGIIAVRPHLPAFTNDLLVVPSPGGDEIFVFDANGKHLRTVSALTGAVRYAFTYESHGFLSSITDRDGRVTTFSRDETGRLTGVETPDGQHTSITLDAQGYLSEVEDPTGRKTSLQHDVEGLLSSIAGRAGNYAFHYDDDGRVTQADDPTNAKNQLARSPIMTSSGTRIGYQVSRTGPEPERRAASYQFLQETSGATEYSDTTPGIGTNRLRFDLGGGSSTRFADGSTSVMSRGQDEISGASDAPQSFSVTTPSGRGHAFQVLKFASRDTEGRVTAATVERRQSGRQPYTSTFDATLKQWTHRSPEGRIIRETIDAQERTIASTVEGLEPIRMEYEAGRLVAVRHGSGERERAIELAYESGFVATIKDALGQTTTFVRDSGGRVLFEQFQDGREIGFVYDETGSLSQIVPPGRSAHALNYTPVDLLLSYVPPPLEPESPPTRYEYDADRNLLGVIRPDELKLEIAYDAASRPTTVSLPAGYGLPAESVTHVYSEATGQLTSLSHSSGVTLTFKNDGFLIGEETIAGLGPEPIIVKRDFDNDFRLISETVAGENDAAFLYDQDGLLIAAGALTLTRHSDHGLITGTTLGHVTESWQYNSFAEPTSYVARAAETKLLETTFADRDKLVRLTAKTETLLGETTAWTYTYDIAGRLTDVTRNGTVWSHYEYDANGNRTLAFTSWPIPSTVETDVDQQDRLLSHGATAFEYTPNGDLRTKTERGRTTTYTYDALGNLRIVQLPNGTRIDYLVDGRNRRVGKKVNGALVQAFVYGAQLTPVAELDGAGEVVTRFVYGTRVNVPEYLVKEGVTYRLLADHLGSPRLVVDVSTGNVVQRLDYDEWGNVMNDTNPGFQPFGFAGGIYDRDTGLIRFGARDYDARVGRWTAKDPTRFHGGINLFAYVAADPVNRLDRAGTAPGDSYRSQDEIARILHKDVNPKSIRWDHEFGTAIYQNQDGTYSYTSPAPGGRHSCTIPGVPSGTGFAGDHHTHGSDAPDPITGDTYEDEEFSGPDQNAGNGWLPTYLSTPQGFLKKRVGGKEFTIAFPE